MKIVATTSLPAVDRPNADRWNADRSRQLFKVYSIQDIIMVSTTGELWIGLLRLLCKKALKYNDLKRQIKFQYIFANISATMRLFQVLF